ncbi:hypothetical protein PO909_014301 [Leuciscus waleckii]
MNVPVKEETITSTMKKLFWKAYFSIGLTHLPDYRRAGPERVKGSLRNLRKSSPNNCAAFVRGKGLLERATNVCARGKVTDKVKTRKKGLSVFRRF